jgi:hypothetical protein
MHQTRRTFALMSLAVLPAVSAAAQTTPAPFFGGSGRGLLGVGLSNTQVSAGLKEALNIGSGRVIDRLGVLNGFFGDGKVKIPLPGLLGDAQRSLSGFGLSAPLDDVQLRMNRAAEEAVPGARRIFGDVINGMTIEDAVGILRGGDTSATDFLKDRMSPRLTTMFRPMMNTALSRAGAVSAFENAARRYGATAYARNARGQLTDWATQKALDGVFLYLADEERAIRRDPVRRTTDILRRVFG